MFPCGVEGQVVGGHGEVREWEGRHDSEPWARSFPSVVLLGHQEWGQSHFIDEEIGPAG